MKDVQPGQLLGLVFAVGLIVVGLIVMNFRTQVWAAVRWCAAVARQAIAAGAILRVNVPVVNHFVDDEEPEEVDNMSSGGQTGQTDKTDRQTDRLSEAEQWMARLKVDRTKTTLIELLVYSEWGVGEIRAALKGDSGAIGDAVRAARGEGDAPDPDVHVTPIAGRVTKREYYPDEPELEFRAP